MATADTSITYRILDGSEIALAAGKDDFDGYEQIAVTGEYKGHWQGKFEITAAMLNQMRDFGNSKKIDTVCDYGHRVIWDSSADASGWIKPGDFEVRELGKKKAALFAKITWTEAARAKIAAGEIKYKSPTVVFNTVDRKTGRTGGASIHSVALTNTPFLHELPEVRLNSIMDAIGQRPAALNYKPLDTAGDQGEHPMKEALIKLLGLADSATDEQIQDAVKALAEAKAAADDRYSALAAEIDGDDKAAALAELKAKAATADATTARVAALEAAEAVREQERKDAAALAAVKSAQAEGKILADDTEHFKQHLELAKKDPERFAALAASMPKLTPAGDDTPERRPDGGDAELTEVEKDINDRLGLSAEDYAKYGSQSQG